MQDDSEQARKYDEYGQVEHQASVSHEVSPSVPGLTGASAGH